MFILIPQAIADYHTVAISYAGFSNTSREVIRTPSFEVEGKR